MFLNKLIKNKHHILIVTVLVVLSYLHPAGIQFKICFGDDGHFDVSAEADWNKHSIPHKTDLESVPDEHHGDCQDFILTSNDMVSCRANSGFSVSRQTVNRLHDMPVSSIQEILTEKSRNISYYSGFLSERCDYIPPFLSSTILLI